MATLTYKGSYINKNSYNQGDVVVYPVNTPWVAWANVKPGVRPGVNPLEWGNVPKGTGDSILFNGITLSVDDWLDNLATSTTILNPSACIEVPKPVDYNILARLQALEDKGSPWDWEPDFANAITIPTGLVTSGTTVSTSVNYTPSQNGYIMAVLKINGNSIAGHLAVGVSLSRTGISNSILARDDFSISSNDLWGMEVGFAPSPVRKDVEYRVGYSVQGHVSGITYTPHTIFYPAKRVGA